MRTATTKPSPPYALLSCMRKRIRDVQVNIVCKIYNHKHMAPAAAAAAAHGRVGLEGRRSGRSFYDARSESVIQVAAVSISASSSGVYPAFSMGL